MPQKLSVNKFELIEDTSQFNEDFIKTIMKKLKQNNAERMKIEKVEKIVTDYMINCEYVIHITKLKQALNHGLILQKVHRVIKFNQKPWLKPYINMNTKLTQKAKNNFEKDFFKLINNSVFGKAIENVKKT